jgi:hypothetical protein
MILRYRRFREVRKLAAHLRNPVTYRDFKAVKPMSRRLSIQIAREMFYDGIGGITVR